MEQLLSIKSIPMKFELDITPAQLKYSPKRTNLDVNRIKGAYQMRSSMARLNINTLEARNSVCPTTTRSISQAAQKGLEAAREYTAQTAREGKMLVNAKPGENVLGRISTQKAAAPTGEFQLGFIPTVGPEIQFIEPSLDIQYQADKLQFDARVTNGNVEYIRGEVNMNITQWPDVIIEYLGQPLYVPPSSQEQFLARA